jgi:hypothetical protein
MDKRNETRAQAAKTGEIAKGEPVQKDTKA